MLKPRHRNGSSTRIAQRFRLLTPQREPLPRLPAPVSTAVYRVPSVLGDRRARDRNGGNGRNGHNGHNGQGTGYGPAWRYTYRTAGDAWLRLAASVFTHSPEGIMILSAGGRVIDVNPRFTAITGLTRETVIGCDISALKLDGGDDAAHHRMWQELAANGFWSAEVTGHVPDDAGAGPEYAALLRIRAVGRRRGHPAHFIALLADITGLRRQHELLERKAHYDPLTGLPNRALFHDRLTHALAQARRRGNLMAMVYIDLDGFKAVNDTYGHAAGDALLVCVAQRMKDDLREGDTLCRLGGDEFAAILTDLSGVSECIPVIERLLRSAAEPVEVDGHRLVVSASIGVTLFPRDASDADALLAHADQAMYRAKQSGKNRYRLFAGSPPPDSAA